MADNSFISKDHKKGLLIGSLLAAGTGLATGNILDALKAGSTAYVGGMNQLYEQRTNELQNERIQEMINASQIQQALEQRKFEQEGEEWKTKKPYLESQTGYHGVLSKKTEQEMIDDKALRDALDKMTGIDPELKAILQSDAAARKSFVESKYGLDKTNSRWADYSFPNGKYAGAFDLNSQADRDTIKKLGLIPYSTPSQRMSPEEAEKQAAATTRGQLKAQKEFFSVPGAAGSIERNPQDKLMWDMFSDYFYGGKKFGTPEREK